MVIDISGDQAPNSRLNSREPVPAKRGTRQRRKSRRGSASRLPRVDALARVLGEVPSTAPVVSSKPDCARIVVDAGHGGKDPGAIGPQWRAGKGRHPGPGPQTGQASCAKPWACDVVLTRDRDIYLPLEERTAIANKVGADLFISVHANAATNRQAYGIETYYLNFSKNDKAAAVAARENGTSLKEVGDLELILFDLMANSKINESSRLAAEIQKSLVDRLSEQFERGPRPRGPSGPVLRAARGHHAVGAGRDRPSSVTPARSSGWSAATSRNRPAEAIAAAVRNYALCPQADCRPMIDLHMTTPTPRFFEPELMVAGDVPFEERRASAAGGGPQLSRLSSRAPASAASGRGQRQPRWCSA
ncbi:MAG: N-acetylmuramoyl-L-alanine amidase [Candidatus Moduliflexus flocculans]|nr:N-acetylmuramoyl-L-alanine amidase [Candidatus Moduliflexus flocculans]